MKLVVDIDQIMANLTNLASSIEEYNSALSSFKSASIDCSLDEVRGVIEDFKSSISQDLEKLNTSSEEYKVLVDECCTEYQANEENVQIIDSTPLLDVVINNPEVTSDYKGDAASVLTGLPSTEIVSPVYYDPNLKYNEGGLPIPYFNQRDYPDVYIGDSNVADGGCGYTSVAMIASYLTRTNISPKEIGERYPGFYVPGVGMSHSLVGQVAGDYKLGTVREVYDKDEMYQALADGKAVISTQSYGRFTRGGHLIVLRGIDENGNILVNDPNGYNAYDKGYNNKSFTLAEIDESAGKYFIFEGDGENVKVKQKEA